MLADVQAGRLLTRDLSNNIHLTITGVARQQQPHGTHTRATDTDSSESTTTNQVSSVTTLLDTIQDDKKPIKVEPTDEAMFHFDIFGDAYAAFLSAPKAELEENT